MNTQTPLISVGNNTGRNTAPSSSNNPYASVLTAYNNIKPATSDSDIFSVNPYESSLNPQDPTVQSNKPTGQIQSEQLKKILQNERLVELLEKHIAGTNILDAGPGKTIANKEEHKELNELLDALGVNRGSINEYIDYKNGVLQSIAGTNGDADKVTKILNNLDMLPDAMKSSILEELAQKIDASEALGESSSTAFLSGKDILKSENHHLIKDNEALAKAIGEALDDVGHNATNLKKLDDAKYVTSNERGLSTLKVGGAVTAALGVGGFFFPPLWIGAAVTGGLTGAGLAANGISGLADENSWANNNLWNPLQKDFANTFGF